MVIDARGMPSREVTLDRAGNIRIDTRSGTGFRGYLKAYFSRTANPLCYEIWPRGKQIKLEFDTCSAKIRTVESRPFYHQFRDRRDKPKTLSNADLQEFFDVSGGNSKCKVPKISNLSVVGKFFGKYIPLSPNMRSKFLINRDRSLSLISRDARTAFR
jgi:hypothetical protein